MKRELWKEFKYFVPEEFNSPDHNRSGLLMDYNFVKLLDQVRQKFGKPIKINSGYRTREHNQHLIDIGMRASPNSSHMKGIAADIRCTNSVDRGALLGLFRKAGVKRFGIDENFIHVDIDRTKRNATWLYKQEEI